MSKVACETAAAALPDAGAAAQLSGSGDAGSGSLPADDPGAPAESVVLRVPDGVCLTHLFGAALRRDASTKGSSNPKAAAEAATRKGAPSADSRRQPATTTATASSSRKTAAAAVVIGVLPASKVVVVGKERRAPGRVVVAARAWRRPAAGGGARVFASEAVLGPEPVSPKVSCFGAVLPSERSAGAAPPPGAGTQEEEEEKGSGCWASLGTALLGLRGDSDDRGVGHLCRRAASERNPMGAAPEPQRVAAVMSPPRPAAAPGLGDAKRLASRRWPEETMAPGTV